MKILDRYEIVAVKRGGMGEVAICRDTQADASHMVAIKSIAPERLTDNDARRQFARESEAWMMVGRAPGSFVLPLEEVIAQNEMVFLKMPFCSKGSLADLLKAGHLSSTVALEFSTELLLGLYMLNEQLGLVHRDVKPHNILINDEGRLQLADLGLAKFIGRDSARSAEAGHGESRFELSAAGGTLFYGAPEQLLGIPPIDCRADMWAFGIVVHELFTGRLPFPPDNPESHLKRIMSSEPRDLRELGVRSSADVAAIVAKCLVPNPQGRYPRFADLVAAWDKAIKTTDSPAPGLFRRDRRLPVRRDSPADYAWTGVLFPERLASDQGYLSWDLAALAGSSEARDYYRLDHYEKAIAAAAKTLGNSEDSRSNFSRLMNGELTNQIYFERVDSNARMTSRVGPSRDVALDALRFSMRSLVALIESRQDNQCWITQLRGLAQRVMTARLDDADVLMLAAEGFVLAGEHDAAVGASTAALRLAPLDMTVGWVALQAAQASGNVAESRVLAATLIERHVREDGPSHYGFAVRVAYAVQDAEAVIRLGAEALQRAPEDVEVLARLVSVLLVSNRRDEARSRFNTLKRIAPDAPQTKLLSGAFERAS